ncbi:transmembrane emp24 domain-containing protein 6-like [Engraulis encrasicolus]|uniref:transmembrane emp24 domain-containing protein 6-like n=1 Tax=Engraulis encrasicolus TaxID=184585 RepID=UPI002FD5CD8E
MSALRWYWTLLVLVLVLTGLEETRAQKSEPRAAPGVSMFRGADQYNFAILLGGSGYQCYWHFAHQTGRFYLTYMVQRVSTMSADRRVHVTVLSPEGVPVAYSDKPLDQITLETQMTGFYQMCFGNFLNKFGTMQVYLDFGVYYEGSEPQVKSEEELQIDADQLNSTLTNIQEITGKLKSNLFHMWRYFNYGRMKRSTDHYLLESNSAYVTWWSAAQSLLIIMAGYLQLYTIKRFFHTQPNRPRC